MKFEHLLKAASLGVALSAFAANDATAQDRRAFGLGQPAAVEELPAGQFRDALLALEPRARARAMQTLRGGEFTTGDLPYMRVDGRGGVFYEDPVLEGGEGEELAAPAEISEADAFSLHSKPGAPKTVYLDFDGHVVRGTAWNASSGVSEHPMRAYDTDGSESNWSSAELDVIADVWRRMAEDLAPYDVDVTTEEPPFTINAAANDRIEYGSDVGHILVTPQMDANGNRPYPCGCGGVAYYGGFGNSYYLPGFVFKAQDGFSGVTGPHNIAEAATHELGHNLYLAHDGTSSYGYYSGHGSGNVGWAPIMGVGYYQEVTQWSKGEYADANNTEDDLSKITSYIPYRTDDHEDTALDFATPLLISGGTNVVSLGRVSDPTAADLANKGIIEDRTDIDLFSMDVGVGTIDLTITPGYLETFASSSNRGMNLDIRANLLDESGGVVASSNPDLDTDAQINYAVGVAGRYYLEIEGVGRGDVLGDGYSDYASIGQYYINGTVPEDVASTSPPTAPDDLAATLIGDVNIELDWTDPFSEPDSNEAGYRVYRSVDGGANFSLRASLPRDSSGFSDNNLGEGDYAYYVEVYNSAGTDTSNTTDPILIDMPSVAVATSETTMSGSVMSGSFLDTQQPSGAETLREEHNGGRPQRRRSFLEHVWTVTGVEPGATVMLYITASAPLNTEDEDFVFSYSVNGGPWLELGVVGNGMGTQDLSAPLDAATSGTIQVKLMDADPSTQGKNDLDEVTVEEIRIESGGDPAEQPPTIAITAPADGTTVMIGESVTLVGEAEDLEDGDLSGSIEWNSNLDGYQGTGSSVVATLGEGSHTITASVADSVGNTADDAITVIVTGANTAPTATISSPANGATFTQGEFVSFSGSASDAEDGDISSDLVWTSSLDGEIGTGSSFSTSALSAGTHTIGASVTDSGGLSDEDSITITVEAGEGISLSANGYKDKGRHVIDLTWSDATSANVDVYRDGSFIATVPASDGGYTDWTENRGGGAYTYEVCEEGTSTCSNTANVVF